MDKKFLAHTAVMFTGILFVSQSITEVIARRKPEFWWVLPTCGIAFALSLIWFKIVNQKN